jgi:hypothetical protein
MRILPIVVFAALVGVAIGGAVAYVEVRSDVAELEPPPPVEKPKEIVPIDASAPRAEVDEPHFNFGTMERGREKSHEFVIRNVGGSPLTLNVLSTTCKCTLGNVTGEAIPPGESTHVRLDWKALSDEGPFRQTAKIETNDPSQHELELTIEGEIVKATGVQPPDFVFDKLAVNESKTAEVYVMSMLQDELTVKSSELSDAALRDKFDIRIEPVEKEKLPDRNARAGVKVVLTVKPGLPMGRFDQSLTLHTNLKEGEVLHIPVYGKLVGDISIHGNSSNWLPERDTLDLGQIKSSEGRKARLNLVVRGEHAAGTTFDVVSTDPSQLKVTLGEPKQLKDTLLHVPLEVEVPPGTPPMARLSTVQGEAAKVVLKTSHPTVKELTFSVRFAVER